MFQDKIGHEEYYENEKVNKLNNILRDVQTSDAICLNLSCNMLEEQSTYLQMVEQCGKAYLASHTFQYVSLFRVKDTTCGKRDNDTI